MQGAKIIVNSRSCYDAREAHSSLISHGEFLYLAGDHQERLRGWGRGRESSFLFMPTIIYFIPRNVKGEDGPFAEEASLIHLYDGEHAGSAIGGRGCCG